MQGSQRRKIRTLKQCGVTTIDAKPAKPVPPTAASGVRAANVYTLIPMPNLNGLEPEAYLADVLARIGLHPINRVDELLAWAWAERE